MQLDLGDLTFARGGALLVRRAILRCLPEETLAVTGRASDLAIDLRAWCRGEGHTLLRCEAGPPLDAVIAAGPAVRQRWQGAERAGGMDTIHPHPPRRWGLAARGALVEAGTPEFRFALDDKLPVWSEDAARLYAQAAAAQWDPATAVPWDTPFELPDEVEDAVVQVMTYLIENETAALVVPSRFLAQLHPHFKEVMQLLAIQAADEARHIEVFTRRAMLKRSQLGLSTAGGQASLQTLVEEPDFAIATFLLSVLGEGTFLSLLWFLQHYAPDPVTAAVCRLAAQDESRHVAFGMSHLRSHLAGEPALAAKLMNAVHKRHDALRHTAGLNAEVFDALVLMAAGSWDPEDLAFGYDAMDALLADMHTQRIRRMLKLGFDEAQAEEMSSLHTRNFM
ncbi:MAG: ferritin-like domain-containing protein [Acidobacteria bacterium]|nr:ferritin-like domain-containing protein [Acidobacteriota bacterium]